MYNLCNRSYIAARICSLAEDIKEHCALVDEDIKIIRACINEIEGLITLNTNCATYLNNHSMED